MGIARDVHNLIQSKLASDKETGILPLLRVLASKTVLPPTGQPVVEPPQPVASQQPPVNNMIPDIGKQETNLQKNSLMAKFPGLGAK